MSFMPMFSHIYLERAAQELPLTRTILERFKRATIVEIESYKELFNRPGQRWEHQRRALKLIVAVRRDSFLYGGSPFVPNFNHDAFYYNTPVLNCLYSCEYCYLQGMFASADVVVFANAEEFLSKTADEIGSKRAYLCVSYDTDLLAFEDLFGYCRQWIEFARAHPNITIEIRSKSPNFRAIADIEPVENVVLAWTVSSAGIASRFEHKTPPPSARVASARAALERGWNVRICFDPILAIQDWRSEYRAMVDSTFAEIDGTRVLDVSIGVFRINSAYLRAMQDQNPASRIAHYPYRVENGSASYDAATRDELLRYVTQEVERFVSKEKVCPVPWQS